MIEIKLTQEDLDCNFTHRFELDGYYIEVFMTIFGGRRITIREKDDYGYLVNWCAGKNIEDAETLVGFAKSVIEQDFPKVKFCSDPKPYFNDLSFVSRMKEIGFTPFTLFLSF
jgi:hypothetical protein